MDRRRLLQFGTGAVATVLAGCLGDRSGTTPTASRTPTPTGSPSATDPQLEYTVTNDDDQSHEVDVTLATADGTTVEENTWSLAPGESRSGTTIGHDPGRGPYQFTVSLESVSTSTELKFDECPAYNLGVTVTPDATLSVDREVCQK